MFFYHLLEMQNSKLFFVGLFFIVCSFFPLLVTLWISPVNFLTTKPYTFGSHMCLIFNRSFTLALLRPTFWTGNIPGSANSCRFNKTNLFWLIKPCGFGTNMTTSGCGPFSRCLRVNPTFGLWNKP